MCDLDLTFDLVVVTMTFEWGFTQWGFALDSVLTYCAGYFLDSLRCSRLTLGSDLS